MGLAFGSGYAIAAAGAAQVKQRAESELTGGWCINKAGAFQSAGTDHRRRRAKVI